jgi:hypothetical protein
LPKGQVRGLRSYPKKAEENVLEWEVGPSQIPNTTLALRVFDDLVLDPIVETIDFKLPVLEKGKGNSCNNLGLEGLTSRPWVEKGAWCPRGGVWGWEEQDTWDCLGGGDVGSTSGRDWGGVSL